MGKFPLSTLAFQAWAIGGERKKGSWADSFFLVQDHITIFITITPHCIVQILPDFASEPRVAVLYARVFVALRSSSFTPPLSSPFMEAGLLGPESGTARACICWSWALSSCSAAEGASPAPNSRRSRTGRDTMASRAQFAGPDRCSTRRSSAGVGSCTNVAVMGASVIWVRGEVVKSKCNKGNQTGWRAF